MGKATLPTAEERYAEAGIKYYASALEAQRDIARANKIAAYAALVQIDFDERTFGVCDMVANLLCQLHRELELPETQTRSPWYLS